MKKSRHPGLKFCHFTPGSNFTTSVVRVAATVLNLLVPSFYSTQWETCLQYNLATCRFGAGCPRQERSLLGKSVYYHIRGPSQLSIHINMVLCSLYTSTWSSAHKHKMSTENLQISKEKHRDRDCNYYKLHA